ncbi:DUF1697 domain-containing protein [Isoptericola sp. NEAU-Y5]|uniref:DUF1697 domain-containing protein n=1 Tax=Isoptericola luteus TaxID=2879484 RepID=A0ABS7ZBK1_9MICO|nr:DUF1697 domain-containing protein [Isoptericola sp. NEAU-Y5]MCA5892433.1 DUF1697 domain-containing protein [Isoptericola sp. NEAU-Y5]
MARTIYVVLLRGVNLGAHRRVTSAQLREAAVAAGLADPRTHANSGNLVAVAPERDDDVAARVTAALTEVTESEVPAVALTARRWDAVVRANPFPRAARDDPARLQVHVGPAPVDAAGIARFDLGNRGRELFAVAEGVLYVRYVDGIGTSRVTPAQLDRAAGTWTTGRNWNTVTRLATMARAPAP